MTNRRTNALYGAVAALALASCAPSMQDAPLAPMAGAGQPELTTGSIPIIEFDGLRFRDLDRSGSLTAYEDWRLSPERRAADLIGRMTLEEKAGQLIVPGLNPNAEYGQQATGHDLGALAQTISNRHATHLNIRLSADAATLARANNEAQGVAETGRLGIPLVLSSNSRHSYTGLIGASFAAGSFSVWPNSPGFAALGDDDLVRRQADLVRRDLRAVGISMLLGPQIDLATEPRWPRFFETYGDDPALAARMAAAFVTGLQGGSDGLQPNGVAAVIKHFAGYSAAVDGLDAHNRYGRFSRVDAQEFAQHVRPFEGAIDAGAAGVMPSYSVLQGLEFDGRETEQVGAAFNRDVIGGVLRSQLGFDGLVLSDWAIIEDCGDICMNGFPAGTRPSFQGVSTAWGVEDLTKAQRVAKAMNAGVDQFGGLEDAAPIVEAVRSGLIGEELLDRAVRRVMLVDFAMGQYEHPFVDETGVAALVGSESDIAWGRSVQARSMVLLENDGRLPAAPGTRVLLHGVDADAARAAGLVPVSDPAEAELAVMRTVSPFETLHPNYMFGSMQQEGSLAFAPGSEPVKFVDGLPAGLPLVVEVQLDRPAILTPFRQRANVLIAGFGANDDAFLDVLTGKIGPEGRLPFELPSSMASVERQRPGTPSDSGDPLYPRHYRFGGAR
ncbi:glycoside hydrolase family 3 protein [Croceicoccus marinus]|nr:glycoside hydrolase family 3 N-terminal domain-containing protein [Croceicoccus marinus]